MTDLPIDQWAFLHGPPLCKGHFKQSVEDFVVIEELGYEPCGDGEHIYLWVEKVGLNTAFVAEQLAKFCQLPLRAVTYAGRKDKHAITRQWFGIHVPGKKHFDWSKIALEGLTILSHARHNKKLRTGALNGNRFELVLRQMTDPIDAERILKKIALTGVPNYYGAQRFGDTKHQNQGGNLALAVKMINGESIRNRNKRSMAISALRSWLFNQYVSSRITQQIFARPVSGDVAILSGSNSFFTTDQWDDTLLERLASHDINLSAPLWGQGELATRLEAHQFEHKLAQAHHVVCEHLESLGLSQERRAIRLIPTTLSWQWQANDLAIQFSLPSGCFATSLVREIMAIEEQ